MHTLSSTLSKLQVKQHLFLSQYKTSINTFQNKTDFWLKNSTKLFKYFPSQNVGHLYQTMQWIKATFI